MELKDNFTAVPKLWPDTEETDRMTVGRKITLVLTLGI
jgi:hypothetical protein